jgi:hypothetical protein
VTLWNNDQIGSSDWSLYCDPIVAHAETNVSAKRVYPNVYAVSSCTTVSGIVDVGLFMPCSDHSLDDVS